MMATEMEERTMEKLGDVVKAYLEADGWEYEFDEESGTYRTGYSGESGNFAILVHAAEEENLVLLYMAIEDIIPLEARTRLCEYLCRANYGLAMGNFEIDMADGEVVFRVSADVESVGLTETTVGNMFEEAALTMDRFYPGLVKVAYEGVAPVDAIPPGDEGHTANSASAEFEDES